MIKIRFLQQAAIEIRANQMSCAATTARDTYPYSQFPHMNGEFFVLRPLAVYLLRKTQIPQNSYPTSGRISGLTGILYPIPRDIWFLPVYILQSDKNSQNSEPGKKETKIWKNVNKVVRY